jgi:hypothetical protein
MKTHGLTAHGTEFRNDLGRGAPVVSRAHCPVGTGNALIRAGERYLFAFITKPQEYDNASSGVPRASNRLHHDAARKNGVRKFRGGSAQGSARAEQNHFDAAEIRQAVTIREFDKAHRDHIFRENRNA